MACAEGSRNSIYRAIAFIRARQIGQPGLATSPASFPWTANDIEQPNRQRNARLSARAVSASSIDNVLTEPALNGIYFCYISFHEVLMDTAKVFWSGRSQAVRLPKEFRLDADEVRVRRHGRAIILEPIASDWAWLDSVVGPLDDDFAEAAREKLPEQDRPDLDFFK
ncbi:antitoxin [Caballeronia sp. LjRoot31]|uniref:antitoxin n=2 Tax=unclassified Caballeronia TaxID=2646786 RepID=UPI003F4F83DB